MPQTPLTVLAYSPQQSAAISEGADCVQASSAAAAPALRAPTCTPRPRALSLKIAHEPLRQWVFSGQILLTANVMESSSLKKEVFFLTSMPLLFPPASARTNYYSRGDWIPLSFFHFLNYFK